MSVLPSANPETQPATQATPQTVPSATPQEQAPQENKPLTLADVERIVTEKATRIAQSMVDKASYRLSREAQEKIDALRTHGQTFGLTAEQVQSKMQEIVTNDLTAPQTPQASESLPEAEPQQPPQLIDYMQSIFQAEGVAIEDGDPELAKILEVWQDPNGNMHKFNRAVYGAIDAKRQRLQRIETTARVSTPGGGGGGNQTTTYRTPEEKIAAGLRGTS